MCGILTYYHKCGISKENLKSSINALNVISHRGPDGEGMVLINTKTVNLKPYIQMKHQKILNAILLSKNMRKNLLIYF